MKARADVSSETLTSRSRMSAVWLILSTILFTVEVSTVKLIGERLPPSQIALARALGGVILVSLVVIRLGVGSFRTNYLKLHLLRGFLSVLGLWCYFFSFSRLPLASATAITFTKGFFIVILAGLLLGEKIGSVRWALIVATVIGSFLALRPSPELFFPESIVALTSAFLGAAIIIVSKFIARTEAPITIMIYIQSITFLGWVVPGILGWEELSWSLFWPLLIIGLVGPAAQYLGIVAFSAGDASMLAPLTYLPLVFNIAIGFLLFGEDLSAWVITGSIIIILAGLFGAFVRTPA